MKKDNVDLICSVGELAGLFDKSASLNDFLQTVVSVVAYHMRAAVCSIYLYEDESKELVLRASQGLSKESIGVVRLKVGEGLTGKSVKELRPVREAQGNANPLFKYFPGIGEEAFSSFLAVPVLRGLNHVGALVVQDPESDYFDDNDTKALQAIAAQLASTVENANLFISLHQYEQGLVEDVDEEKKFRNFYIGTTASEGLAFGKAVVIGQREGDFTISEADQSAPYTLEEFLECMGPQLKSN